MERKTKHITKAAMALCIGLVLASCGGRTRLTETWKDPNYKSGPVSKILVIGVTDNERVRRVFERKFVKALRAAGAEAHSSYAVLHISGELKKEDVLAAVRKTGADAVLITSLVNVDQTEVFYRPPPVGYYDAYGLLYGISSREQAMAGFDINVVMNTSLYDAHSEKLIWSTLAETRKAKSKKELLEQLIAAVVKKLRRENLLAS